MYLYMRSFYWAYQTITTVGFGDFKIRTTNEYCLAVLWMIIGFYFYAFLIANLINMIDNYDKKL